MNRREFTFGAAVAAVMAKLPPVALADVTLPRPIFEGSIGSYQGVIIRTVPQWVMNDLRANPQTFDFIGGVEIDGQA